MLELLLYLHDLAVTSFQPLLAPRGGGGIWPPPAIIVPNAPILSPGSAGNATGSAGNRIDPPPTGATIEILLVPPLTPSLGLPWRGLAPASILTIQLHPHRGAGIFHIKSLLTRPIAGNAVAHRALRIRPAGALDYTIWISQAYDAFTATLDNWAQQIQLERKPFPIPTGFTPDAGPDSDAAKGIAPLTQADIPAFVNAWLNERLPPHLTTLNPPTTPPASTPALNWIPVSPSRKTPVLLAHLGALGSATHLKVFPDRRYKTPDNWQWALVQMGAARKRTTQINQPDTSHYATQTDAMAAAYQQAITQGWLPQAPPLRFAIRSADHQLPGKDRGPLIKAVAAKGAEHLLLAGTIATCDPYGYIIPAPLGPQAPPLRLKVDQPPVPGDAGPGAGTTTVHLHPSSDPNVVLNIVPPPTPPDGHSQGNRFPSLLDYHAWAICTEGAGGDAPGTIQVRQPRGACTTLSLTTPQGASGPSPPPWGEPSALAALSDDSTDRGPIWSPLLHDILGVDNQQSLVLVPGGKAATQLKG